MKLESNTPPVFNSLILDATAFFGGFNLNVYKMQHPQVLFYITPGIYTEIVKNPTAEQIITIGLDQNYIQIQNPNKDYITRINQTAFKTGDIKSLSKNDISLIALGLELKSINSSNIIGIISDDYSVQNVCHFLNIPILNVKHSKIKTKIQWEIYCPNCYSVFSANQLGNECDHCGEPLKRRKFRGKRNHL